MLVERQLAYQKKVDGKTGQRTVLSRVMRWTSWPSSHNFGDGFLVSVDSSLNAKV